MNTSSSAAARERPTESLSIRTRRGVKRLVTGREWRAGMVISTFDVEEIMSTPNRFTVQIGRDEHAYVGYLAAANHSCDPNVVVDTTNMTMVARDDLAKGDELSFFYPSTEWDMAAPFACRCKSADCIKLVAGARFLPSSVLEKYFLNAHIRALIVTAIDHTALHSLHLVSPDNAA